MIETGLNDKVAIVTGANHGIGAATAVELARQGARVMITFLHLDPREYGGIEEQEALAAESPGRAFYYRILMRSADEVLRTIESQGGAARAWEADLSDPAAVPELFDRTERAFGPADILVNNAAFDQPDTFLPSDEIRKQPLFVEEYPLQPLSAQSHDRHFAVNSRAVALLMREFAARHIRRGAERGRIVNVSTDGAYAHPSNVSYGASKLAMESYTRAAAFELGPYGITVNSVSPGAVQTGWMPDALERRLSGEYPLRRIGRPEDIARAVLFFASDLADWITGQVLFVGGGHRM